MATSALILPVSGEQDVASWAAVAFVASDLSPGTRQAYTTQLRLRFDWCTQHHLEPLADVRRPHVEFYARDLETRGLAPSGVHVLANVTQEGDDGVGQVLVELEPHWVATAGNSSRASSAP